VALVLLRVISLYTNSSAPFPRLPRRAPEYCCAMASELYKGTVSSEQVEHHRVFNSSATVPQYDDSSCS
jgi:hypothetical protein